jgi:tetratricopeptide (TPR) repeat protein
VKSDVNVAPLIDVLFGIFYVARRSNVRCLAAFWLVAAALITPPVRAESDLDKAARRAHEQLEKGRAEDAVKTLTKAAEKAGTPGYLALGRLEERLSHLDEARAAYERAEALASPATRPDALVALATFTLRAGTGHQALVLAEQAVEAAATATTLAAKARAQVRAEDATGALETADQAVSTDPRSSLAHTARGEALFALGRNDEAQEALKRAAGLDPRSALAYSRLARVQTALGDTSAAVASARRATELDESFGEGFAILGWAMLARDLNSWGEAIAQAQQGAFLDPGNPIVHTIVGRVFEANGQADQAVLAFRRALEHDAEFAPARLALIEAELARGRRDVALEEAQKAATAMPTSPQIQLLLGEMAEREGNHETALGYLEKALEGLPGNADGWALLGRACQFTARVNDAADAYGRAVELAPQNLAYRTTHGLLLGMSGDLDGGLAELTKVVQTPGYTDADAWVNLGWIHRNRNEPAESTAAYRKALELDPKHAQAALGLGWALTQTKEYDEAIAWYRKAAELDESVAADAWWGTTLAYIYELDVEKAREFERKTIAAGRTDPRLAEYIERLDKGLLEQAEERERLRLAQEKAAERARRAQAARNATRSSDPKVRARGARQLVLDPDEGVEILIYLLRTDPDWTVRIEAARSLGRFGPEAGKAVPHIEGILRQDRYVAPVGSATDEQLNNEMLDGDLHKVLQESLEKIQR